MKKAESPLIGRWRITWMEEWDQEYVDAEFIATFEFRPDGQGDFHFGYVSGEIDHRLTSRDGKPAVEFSWDGNADMDEVHGRGWATLAGKNNVEGMILFHHGDESAFKAKRMKGKLAK